MAVKPGPTALVAGPKPLDGLAMTELPRLPREVHAAAGEIDELPVDEAGSSEQDLAAPAQDAVDAAAEALRRLSRFEALFNRG